MFYESDKVRFHDGRSRRTKYYYHPSTCPRSWPNYKRNDSCLKSLTNERSLSRNSVREIQAYPRQLNNKNSVVKLKENSSSLNIIITDDARKVLRAHRSRAPNNIHLVLSSSDDSLQDALLRCHRYPKKDHKHLSERVLLVTESRGKDTEGARTTCEKYCEKYRDTRSSDPNQNNKKRPNPNPRPREYTKIRDACKTKKTGEKRYDMCAGYCETYQQKLEETQNVRPADTKIPRYTEGKREAEYDRRYMDTRDQEPPTIRLSVSKKLLNSEELQQKNKEGEETIPDKPYTMYQPPTKSLPAQDIPMRPEEFQQQYREGEKSIPNTKDQPPTKPSSLLKKRTLSSEQLNKKYKETEALIEEKPYLMYQHPTDRATLGKLEEMKQRQASMNTRPDNELNAPSTSSRQVDQQYYQRGNDAISQLNKPGPSPVVGPTVREQSYRKQEPVPFQATSVEDSKTFLIESVTTSSTDDQSDLRLTLQKQPPVAGPVRTMYSTCSCEGSQYSRKGNKPESKNDIPQTSDTSKYGYSKEGAGDKLLPENFKSCHCGENKTKSIEDDEEKSRLTQHQESPKKDEMVDAATQVVGKQSDTQQLTTDSKYAKRQSSVSWHPQQQLSSITSLDSPSNSMSPHSQTTPPYPPQFMNYGPNLPTEPGSTQYAHDQSTWTSPYSGARPEWKIIAPGNIVRSPQFRCAMPFTNPQYSGNSGCFQPYMANRNPLTLHKVAPLPQQQPNIGCCASKISISRCGLEFHQRSASCSFNTPQNTPSRNLNPSLSFGGMPFPGMSQIPMPPTPMAPNNMPLVPPNSRMGTPMMSGTSLMRGQNAPNNMFPGGSSLQSIPGQQMPSAYFPWAQEQPRFMSPLDKQEGMSASIPLPQVQENTPTVNEFPPYNRLGTGSYLQPQMQLEMNNQTNLVGRNVYQPESYYPPQRSFSSSATPYFSNGYSASKLEFGCINKLKCRDPNCGQKMNQSTPPVPPSSYYNPYNSAMNSEPTSNGGLNNVARPTSPTQIATQNMLSCGAAKSCIALNDKNIICSAQGPIRMCARDPQAGIPCQAPTSEHDASGEGRMLSTYDIGSLNMNCIMERIMSNVNQKACRGSKECRVPGTIREVNENNRQRSSSRGRTSDAGRCSKRCRGQSSKHRAERRKSGRRHTKKAKRKSEPKHHRAPQSRPQSSKGTSPASTRSATPSNSSLRVAQGTKPGPCPNVCREMPPCRSLTSRGTSPGLRRTSLDSNASKGSNLDTNGRRISRGTSPGIERTSQTNGSRDQPTDAESQVAATASPMQNGQQGYEITDEELTGGSAYVNRNPDQATSPEKREAKAKKICPGPSRCKTQMQQDLHNTQAGNETSHTSTNSTMPHKMENTGRKRQNSKDRNP